MSLNSQIAHTIAGALTYTAPDDRGGPIVIGKERAMRIAQAVADVLWDLAAPTVWDGRRGRSLFMERGVEGT